jgi:hypothetical protein
MAMKKGDEAQVSNDLSDEYAASRRTTRMRATVSRRRAESPRLLQATVLCAHPLA